MQHTKVSFTNSFLSHRYLVMKFEEMEEKMRRQKQKGAHKNTESEENENVVKAEDAETEAVSLQTPSVDQNDSTEFLDQLHERYVTTATAPPPMETVTLAMAEQQPTYTQIQRVPSPPRTVVESERLHLVEIKSDGTSGHLVRLPSGGYEQH